MKMPWLAAVLNFFFMGLGYLYNGRRRVLGIGWTAAAVGLTYVEMSLRAPLPNLYWTMFVSVFIANTCFATDGWREAQEINRQLKR